MRKLALITLLLALAPAAMAPTAMAQDIAWTWAEAGYNNVDIDDLDDGDGFYLAGSVGLPLNVYLHGRYRDADLDTFNVDLETTELGVGWHLGLGDLAQGLVEAAWYNAEASGFGSVDSDGYQVAVGARVAPLGPLELGGKLGYRDVDDIDDGTWAEIYALWKVFGPLGLTVNAEFVEDATTWGIGVRASF